MISFKNEKFIFNRMRCCQCGVCIASCQKDALSCNLCKDGLWSIVCDSRKCVACGICAIVCPAVSIFEEHASAEQVKHAKGIFLAHASDNNVRFMASSGGVARTLLNQMLVSMSVNAAYSIIYPYSLEQPDMNRKQLMVSPAGMEAEGRWLTEAPPTERIPCSLYRPVLWGKQLQKIDKKWKKVLLIGLPCQLKGATRLLSKIAPKLDVVKVALFCRQQKTQNFTGYIKQILRIPDLPDTLVCYRGQGWPGKTGAGNKTLLFTSAGSFAFGRCALWRVPGCRLCSDCLGTSVADLTLGDPWSILTPDEDSSGTNIVIAWTDRGLNLLSQFAHAVVCRSISSEIALKTISPASIERKFIAVPYYLGMPTGNMITRIRLNMAELQRRIYELLLKFFGHSRLFRLFLSKIPFPFD